MDPMEILGSLLGQKSGGSGLGADILKQILLGGAQPGQSPPAPSPQSKPASTSTSSKAPPYKSGAPRSGSPPPRAPAEDDIEATARELEDLLNVANNRRSAPPAQAPRTSAAPAARKPTESTTRREQQDDDFFAARRSGESQDEVGRQNEQALTLVRAMVQAAKCDGEISRAEQDKILGQLESPSTGAIAFLREEFAKPFDVREFAWSVPVGMEQQVYTMSLIAIDVDSIREEKYLRDLAHGLRLTPEVCEQIKERLTGASVRLAGAR